MRNIKIEMMLQLMAEGGTAAAGDGGGDGVKVDTGTETAAPAVDLEAEFDALVKGDGKYREIYGKRQQKAVQQRMRGVEGTVAKYNALSPALDILAARYGTTADDPKLAQMISEDKELLEDKAIRNGTNSETELALARAAAAEQRANGLVARILADQDYQRWTTQAQQVAAEFPGFDLEAELQNEQFRNLLQNFNLDVRGAYMALHSEDAIRHVRETATKKVTDTVAAGKARPVENGTGRQAAASTGTSPMKMSSAEFKAVQERIARGEVVDFTRR